MLQTLLNKEVQTYITSNLNVPISKLALQKNPFPEIDFKLLLNQIEAKKKAKEKLPTWFENKNILYPKKISIEQTSSEKTAEYKSKLISGSSIIDLTGGFGVDAYYFAKEFQEVNHCEIDEELSQIVAHNFKELGVKNCTIYAADSANLLEKLNRKFDCIYIDPSRRNDSKGKVFLLEDCEPNVVKKLDFYFKYSNVILIKTAPLFDITAGLQELKNVHKIHIIALENEVKEVLWEIHKGYNENHEIQAVNISKNNISKTYFDSDQNYQATYALPKKFLYEPNAAILKSGKFNGVSQILKIDKLHLHSHLYTSNEIIDFPGRSFEIVKVIPFQKTEIQKHLAGKKYNCTTRNFPISVEDLRKKHKIYEGGSEFAFFTTNIADEKIILLTQKI